MLRYAIIAILALLLSCSPDPDEQQPADAGTTSAQTDMTTDAAVAPDSGADGDGGFVSAATYELSPALPTTGDVYGERRGKRIVRGIIHAHSVHSHDACDGEPELEDGSPNEPCLDDFRAAICATKQDFVFLTEHEELAAMRDFEDVLLLRDDDEPLTKNGAMVANRIACPDGHRPLLIPGGEFGTMPVGLEQHTGVPGDELSAEYDRRTPEQVQRFRDAGAVVLQAHAESKNRESLRTLGLDGFEVYQLHANVDPEIRGDYLGLEPAGFLADAGPFIQGGGGAPDLVFLTFFAPNEPSLAHFDALVSEGQHLVGTAGTDCHQNVFWMKMSDGERVDSYRRMMRWFANYLAVDEVSPEGLKNALREDRLWIVFEAFGTPDGFDFYAEDDSGIAEIGGTATMEAGAELVVERPDLYRFGKVPVRLELKKIEASGAVTVAEGTDTLRFTPDEPGAYRAVVHIRPEHLMPHLQATHLELAQREYQWIWANPIYVD